MRHAAAVAILGILVAACAADVAGGSVDGWLIGAPATCTDRVITTDGHEVERGTCADLLAAAAAALDRRDPGHAPVTSSALYDRRPAPGTVGGLQYVVVYRLGDGSTRAIGVGWPGVATTPYTIDFGP